ncbi:MAG: DUF4236 domain-containing protein [Pyrinomonadaceae bacterium]
MGFSFRKSFKLGPVRLNLSKSGVSASTKIAPGVRVSASRRGAYVSAGAGGFTYRERLGQFVGRLFGKSNK